MDLKQLVLDLCLNPKHTKWIAPLIVLGDVLLCVLIIWKIPYTEIDWTTYMEQVSLYIYGERDYTLIKGSTGPLVYPAAHVYIYTFFHQLTDEGRDIFLGQIIFAFLYIVGLVAVMLCYRQSGAPPYLFPLLALSKRLHSVFVLRLFNDGIAALVMWAVILHFQQRKWTTGVILWSLGVAIKMTLLLLAPAITVILMLSLPFSRCVSLGAVALLVQVLLAVPFLQSNPVGYVSRAFELTRQFMFKWTVNWRFLGEELFLSKGFSLALLAVHISLLGFFVTTYWLKPANTDLFSFVRDFLSGRRREMALSNSFIMTVMLTSLVIGLLCARSLHYQFFAYLSWATPFLLWRAGLPPILLYTVWGMQEWAWNIYPSTNISSIVVFLSLSIQVFGVLSNGTNAFDIKRLRYGHNTKEQKQ